MSEQSSAQRLVVWRFCDSVIRSHVIAETQDEAIAIFDRVMGREYRDIDDVDVEIYRIPGDTVLPIDFDGRGEFVSRTACEWIEHRGVPCFL